MSDYFKISYMNFWCDPDNDKWFSEFIDKNIGKTIIVNNQDNPDILICSNMGDIDNVKNCDAKLKIFFSGENLNRFPPYNNLELLRKTFDLLLLSYNTDLNEKILRFPLWLLYYKFYNVNEKNNMISYIDKSYRKNINKKKLFLGSLVSRADWNGLRSKLYKELSKYGHVMCPGEFNNNCDRIPNGHNNKIDFISNSLFNICPENSVNELYHSEKIFQALEGGNIPIYWGVDYPEKELIEKDCYCFISSDDINNNLVDVKIKNMIDNREKYYVENIFKRSAIYIVDNYYSSLKWQIKLKFDLINQQKVYGISYASRRFINRYDKIQNEANNSNYFDNFKCYREEDIDDEFKKRFDSVWNNPRGGGYWIWKNYLILRKLNEIDDNDILVYIDAGCKLNTNNQAIKNFNKYIDLVNNHWTGLLKFEDAHKEYKYTNKHTINFFEKKFNIKLDDYVNKNQLIGGILVIRKNKFSMDYFNNINKILNEDVDLFSDKYNLQNEEHRHDQSISSLLYKIMGGSLILKDETYFEIEDKILEDLYPILAKRLIN